MADESLSTDHPASATVSVNTAEPPAPPLSSPPPATRAVAAAEDAPWPWLLRWQPGQLLLAVVGILALTWMSWIAVDAFNVGGLGDRLDAPLWRNLYNDSLIDVVQWVLLALAVVAAGYLAGRIARDGQRREASFFLLLGLGLGLMLIEEASNIRRSLGYNARERFGDTILGIDHTLLTYGPVLTAVSVIPLYALLRYGVDIWRVRPARAYLIGGYAAFAMVAVTSLIKNVGGLYVTLGDALDSLLGGVRLVEGRSRDWGYLTLTDATIEEPIEAIAAASMLAMILAYANAVRRAKSPTQ